MSQLTAGMNLDKPNRLTAKKDAEYHVRYGKFAVSNSYNGNYYRFVNKTRLNRGFYKGGDYQWLEEDIESFLKDDTGQSRNRIKVVDNIIRPMVEQYRGNANRMTINASVKAISSRAMTRKERALNEQMFRFRTAFEYPEFFSIMEEKYAIGETAESTRQIFMNHYRDVYAKVMNQLLDNIQEENQFQDMQMPIALDIALSGLGVVEGRHESGKIVFEKLEVEEFVFDSQCKRFDLRDSQYMGRLKAMSPTYVYEKYNPGKTDVDAIERYVTLNSGIPSDGSYNGRRESVNNSGNLDQTLFSGIRVPVYQMYWKDMEKEEWGYVDSGFGYPKLVKINWGGYNNDQEPEYTDADLITPPDTETTRVVFKGKNKVTAYNEVLRYCHFIPSDVLAKAEPYHSKHKPADIVLDHGIYQYSQVTLNNPSKVEFPFKCGTWGYIDGEILSPVDDAISPQRLINRVLSASEGIINMSGGEGTVIDKDAVDPQDAIDGTIDRNMKQGKAVYLSTRGKGIPNSIGKYDTTPGGGAYQMMQLIPIMKEISQSSTGVNEPLQGQSMGNDQLVGVTELMIERGSLMQEPFYKAIESIFMQMFEMGCTVGKAIAIENEEQLIIATGDEGSEIIKMSKDMINEDFALSVKRDNSDEQLKNTANTQLFQFKEMGMIDETIYANMYNRSKPDDVATAIRQFAIAKQIAAEKDGAAQAAQAEEMAIEEDANLMMADEEGKRQEGRQDQMMDKQQQQAIEAKINDAALQEMANQGK